MDLLKKNPAMGRTGRVAGTQELVVAETPCIIPYRVRGDAVEILRVFHAARSGRRSFEDGGLEERGSPFLYRKESGHREMFGLGTYGATVQLTDRSLWWYFLTGLKS
jgi:hypothetical protein